MPDDLSFRPRTESLEARENPAALTIPRVPVELFQTLATDVQTLFASATLATALTLGMHRLLMF